MKNIFLIIFIGIFRSYCSLAIVFNQSEPVIRTSTGKFPDVGYTLYYIELNFVPPCELLSDAINNSSASFKFDANMKKRVEQLCQEDYERFWLPSFEKFARCQKDQSTRSRFKRFIWPFIIGAVIVAALVVGIVTSAVLLSNRVSKVETDLDAAKQEIDRLKNASSTQLALNKEITQAVDLLKNKTESLVLSMHQFATNIADTMWLTHKIGSAIDDSKESLD